MNASSSDTVVALATPVGEGGLAVLRISGQGAIEIVAKGFRGKQDLRSAKSHTAHFGMFAAPDGTILDEIVAVVFREPASYTGENVVELSCHGGMLVTRKILRAILDYGAKQAPPGEFTKRAFLNGKMDLSQAEAVADLIHAQSDRSHKNSLQQLQGRLARRIRELRDELVLSVGTLELELDFAEEGIELAEKNIVSGQIRRAIENISGLLETYRTGRLYRDGVKVVLAGMPNVGKSSILNALLRENRAIVTDVPGTTRDTIEENLTINGLMFRVVDTAGLREAIDRVEQEGVKRSHDQINTSDLLLVVMDGARQVECQELELAERLVRDLKGRSETIVVINKIDLAPGMNGGFEKEISVLEPRTIVKMSALTGEGIDLLRNALFETALTGGVETAESGITITNARHYDALRRSSESLQMALNSVESGESGEFVTVDMRAALNNLGEITGAITTDDILNEIFSKFCIGK